MHQFSRGLEGGQRLGSQRSCTRLLLSCALTVDVMLPAAESVGDVLSSMEFNDEVGELDEALKLKCKQNIAPCALQSLVLRVRGWTSTRSATP